MSGVAASRSWESRPSFSFRSISQISCASWYEVSSCRISLFNLSHSSVCSSVVDSISARRSRLVSNWCFRSLFSCPSFSELNFAFARSLLRSSTSFSRLFFDDWSVSMAAVLFSLSLCLVSLCCCCSVSFLWCLIKSDLRLSIFSFASCSWLSSWVFSLISFCSLRSLIVNLFLYVFMSCWSWFFADWLAW